MVPELPDPAAAPSTGRTFYAIAALVVAVVASLPPWIGPRLSVAPRVEIVDHAVPAGVIAVAALTVLAVGRARCTTAGLPAALAVALAGVWMSATHVPLVLQALREEVPASTAAWHTAPGAVVLVFGLAWAASELRGADDERQEPTTGP